MNSTASRPLSFVRLDPARDAATVGVLLDADGAPDDVNASSAAILPIGHVVGVGRNYKAHADEQGADLPERPMLFTKNHAACCLSSDDIHLPRCCEDRPQVDYEGELAVVIGSPCRDVSEADALDPARSPVIGYCIANDVSARWWQKQGAGGQFHRGKSFDTFCPLGPAVTPLTAVPDPQALHIATTLNGETVQDAMTGQMIFGVARLIAECSRDATLLPGTIILTGTPAGVGAARTPPRFLEHGDTVTISIAGLGDLTNGVVAAPRGETAE
jgi:2-keto-4-pentenoate hydratase/2-oxohepta-3-ene-1,7-dioic acid hydratase in catechol pathway